MNLMSLLTGKSADTGYHDFPGGVHPPENKTQSLTHPIRSVPLQPQYVVPLNQHIGAFAVPVVAVGDRVLKGQIIADAAGFISAPSHAPTSGTVVAVEERPVPHVSGLTATCVVIDADGQDIWRERAPWQSLPAHDWEELVGRIQASGVTGLGGASFPTAVKLAVERHQIDTLIVNATECEPYITADHALMRERADQLFEGIGIVHHLYDFQQILIGVEDNKADAVKALRDALPEALADRVSIRVFPTKYPSGGEKQLIYLLTGQEVPSGGLPLDLGMLCHNVGTLAALADAVYRDQPLIHRITTLTGEQVAHPGNYDVLIGTPMDRLLSWAGFPAARDDEAQRVIMGGPMMGFALDRLDLPVVKATNCLLAPSHKELPPPGPAQPCIRCGLCEQACPVNLLPQQLMWFAQAREWEKAESHRLFDCIECGACAYVCPSHIPLVQYYRYAKGTIREEQAEHKQAERARKRFEARQARLEREQAEKEARRRERAAAAKARQSDAGTDDPVAAAVARAQAKKTDSHAKSQTASTSGKSAPPALSPEQLQAKLDNQRKRLDKAQAKLAEAEPDQEKALRTTVQKLNEQIQKTEHTLAEQRASQSDLAYLKDNGEHS